MCDVWYWGEENGTVGLEIFVQDFKMFLCPIVGATFATCDVLIRLSDNNKSGSPVMSREL